MIVGPTWKGLTRHVDATMFVATRLVLRLYIRLLRSGPSETPDDISDDSTVFVMTMKSGTQPCERMTHSCIGDQ